MRNVIATTIILSLLGTPMALAQGTGSSGTSSATKSSAGTGSAPVGHRQPRASDVPTNAEKGYQESAEDKALDRKIKSICRGC